MGSPSYSINAEQLQKVGIGAVYAVTQALASYLIAVGPTFDQTTAIGLGATALCAIAVTFLRKWGPDNR